MDQVMQFFQMPVVQAIMWLVAALVVASLVRAIAVGIVNRSNLKGRLSRDAASAQDGAKSFAMTKEYVGRLAFLLTFLLFVPAIFTTLGVGNAGEPVLQMLDRVWAYLPNILAAGIILSVGLLAARLVRQLLVPVFSKIRVDSLQSRTGVKVNDKARLSQALASVVYALIVVPVVIVSLQVLNISAISDPATNMLNTIIGYIPNALAAAVVMAIGVFVARLAGNLVGQLIATTGVDSRMDTMLGEKMPQVGVTQIVNYAVQALIIVFFAVESFSILQLEVFVTIGNALVAYLPNLLAAAVVLGVAAFAAGLLGKTLSSGASARYVPLAQGSIWALAAIMVLTQLNIAGEIAQWGFVMILGAVSVAFALAFGLGGRDFAKRTLDDLSEDAGPEDIPHIDRAA